MTQDDVRALIRDLERDALPIERWTHDAHLAMAVWYLSYLPRQQALRVIRLRIASYNERRSRSPGHRLVYHETITAFLCRGVAAFLDALPDTLCFDERLTRVRAAFRNWRALLGEFYSPQALEHRAARVGWAEPDRRPMHAWLRACEQAAAIALAAPVRLRVETANRASTAAA